MESGEKPKHFSIRKKKYAHNDNDRADSLPTKDDSCKRRKKAYIAPPMLLDECLSVCNWLVDKGGNT